MIKVYTKTTCPHCVETKHKLQAMGIDYEEVNIENLPEEREFLISEGHKSVPQIYINGKVVPGGNQTFQTMTERQIKEWK